MTGPTSPTIDQIKTGMRTAWMAGDFGVIAKSNAKATEEFASGLDLPAGARVLDVATGTGNVAIPLAMAGYKVTGLDIAANLLEQARERASESGVSAQFDEGDAEQMPYPDATFDAVVTMFGAMFAPRPELVAKELARVLKPGGRLAMANWNPEGFSGLMFRTNSKHVPPPPGVPPPVQWGQPATVYERLCEGFDDIETELIPVEFDFAIPPSGVVRLFRTYFGPTKLAFERVGAAGEAALTNDLEDLWSSANIAQNPGSHTTVQNQYLKVTARRR